jgi:hypothetical protein
MLNTETFDTNQIIEMKDEIFYGLTGKQTIYLLGGVALGLSVFTTTWPILVKIAILPNIGIPTAILTKTDIDQGVVSFFKFKWRGVTKQNVAIQPLPKNKLFIGNKRGAKITPIQV